MLRVVVIAGVLGGLIGCRTPANTIFPTFHPAPPEAERRSYEFHSPFAETAIGPDIEARPRGFNTPRTAPRRDAEWSALQGFNPQFEPAQPNAPQSMRRYPGTVPN